MEDHILKKLQVSAVGYHIRQLQITKRVETECSIIWNCMLFAFL